MSSKTLDYVTLRRIYPVGSDNKKVTEGSILSVDSAGMGVWKNMDNLISERLMANPSLIGQQGPAGPKGDPFDPIEGAEEGRLVIMRDSTGRAAYADGGLVYEHTAGGTLRVGGDTFVGNDLHVTGNIYGNIVGTVELTGAVPLNEIVPETAKNSETGYIYDSRGPGFVHKGMSGGAYDTVDDAFVKLDRWLSRYVIGAPPAPATYQMQYIDTNKTSTEIFIPYVPPAQRQYGFNPDPLPLITQKVVEVQPAGRPVPIIDVKTIDELRPKGMPYNGSDVEVIVINRNGLTGIYDATGTNMPPPLYTRTGDIIQGIKRVHYVPYDELDENVVTDPTLGVKLWYMNYDSSKNIVEYDGLKFTTGRPPSRVQGVGADISGATSADVFFSEPEFVEEGNQASRAKITTYYLNYLRMGQPFRYGARPDEIINVTVPLRQPIKSADGKYHRLTENLEPDTLYCIVVSCKNNVTNSLSPESEPLVELLMPPIAAPTNLATGALAFPAGVFFAEPLRHIQSGQDISGGMVVDIAGNPGGILSGNIGSIPIHQLGTRGSTAPNLMTLTAELRSAGGLQGKNSLQFSGFPAGPASTATTSANVSLQYTGPVDTYAGTSDASGYTGYYLQANNIRVRVSGITGSNSQYTLTLKQNTYSNTTNDMPSSGPLTSPVEYSSSLSYYAEYVAGLPTVDGCTVQIAGMDENTPGRDYYVCGVRAYRSYEALVTTRVSNVGRYFFKAPFLEYSVREDGAAVIGSEDSVINYVSHTGTAITSFDPTFDVRRQIEVVAPPAYYAKHAAIYPRVKNVRGESAVYVPPAENMRTIVIDTASYALLNDGSRYPRGALPTIGIDSGSVYGMHMKNAQSFTDATAGAFTALEPYTDHQASIAGTDMLQICAGKFRTPANAAANGGCGYIDYRGYFGMSSMPRDYSGIFTSGYRYVTAGWRMGINMSYGYNMARITIQDISGDLSKIYMEGTPTAFTNGTPLQMYYRIVNNSTPAPSGSLDNESSIWINANSQISMVTQYTYTRPEFSGRQSGLLNIEREATKLVIDIALLPINILPDQNISMYFCVGLPPTGNVEFTGISAELFTLS